MGKKSKKIETVSVQHEGTIYNVTPVLKKVILSLQQDSEKMKKLIFECEIAKGDVKTRDAEIIRLKQQIEQLEFANRNDADIEFTDDEEIKDLGHVGAILRFK